MLEISFWNIAITVINVLILYIVFRLFLFKPVHKVLDARKADIQKQFDDAAAAQKDAENLKAQYDAQMQAVDKEKEAAIAEAKQKANAEYDRIIGSANAESDKIVKTAREKAKAAANEEKRKAEEEIVGMVRDAANKIAESESDEKLYDSFLKKVSDEADAE